MRTHDRRKLAGLCVKCGTIKVVAPRVRCVDCLDSEQLRQAHYQKDRVIKRLCRSCCKPNPNKYVHCDKCRAVACARAKENRMKLRMAAFSVYGGPVCSCDGCLWHNNACQCVEIEILTLDHIDNNGADHRREISYGKEREGGGGKTYRWLKKNAWPSGFVVLCHNCNWSKHITNLRKVSDKNLGFLLHSDTPKG